ncbi:MAG: hypothetical protein IT426_12975 [Pirellulales bacterium]|nr:hypothetical protein [Pirellulales bacterium]
MNVISYEGIVENGCVHVPAGVVLPEKTKVYIIVPGISESGIQHYSRIASPRLANPEQAADFVKKVIDLQEETDAGL